MRKDFAKCYYRGDRINPLPDHLVSNNRSRNRRRGIKMNREDIAIEIANHEAYRRDAMQKEINEKGEVKPFYADDITIDNFEGVIECFKKPVIVHALQLHFPEGFEVTTNHGKAIGKAGDYLMFGINGEKYPCDKKSFEQTYVIRKERTMPSKEEQIIKPQQKSNMETEIISEVNGLNKRVREIIAEYKCESPAMQMYPGVYTKEELLQKSLHEEYLYEAIGKEHSKFIQEKKSHAEDSRRHLTTIKRLMHGLKKLLYEANNLGYHKMLERECSLARELLAECNRKYGDIEGGK